MMNKKILVGIMLGITLLMLMPEASAITYTMTDGFENYTNTTTPATGTTNKYGYTIANNLVTNTYTIGSGHNGSKSLRIGKSLEGQNVSVRINFNVTGNSYSSVDFWVKYNNIAAANKMYITLNTLGNYIVIENLSAQAYFSVKLGTTSVVANATGLLWHHYVFTFNWSTSKLKLSVYNATNVSKGASIWTTFTNRNGYVWSRNNCWGVWRKSWRTYETITGLTFSGTGKTACNYTLDDLHTTCTYTPTWSISNIRPYNSGSYYTKPTCQVTVRRTQGLYTKVYLYEWKNNSWIQKYYTNTTATTFTPYFAFGNATQYQHTYYWNMRLIAQGYTYNVTYRFTTLPRSVIRLLYGRSS